MTDFPRPCLTRSCSALVWGGEGWCSPHAAEAERRRPAHRAAYRDPLYRATRAVLIHGGAPCADCGGRSDLTVDHVTPLSAGGTNDPANLQVLCRSCNSRKGAR